ncbi:MAG TPA: serine hydrolase, partial [Labilithrix sp.]|nr:serine hydrolase [Labilithrix sp.]
CSSCLFGRIMYFGTPSLSAPTYFANRPVRAERPTRLRTSGLQTKIGLTRWARTTYGSFDELLKENRTRAFLAVKGDAIVYERYFDGVSATTQLPSFSISKTFAAVLVGCAVKDGLIRSMDDRLVSYVPELASKPGYGDITIEHLLRMTAGIDFVEDSYAGGAFYYSADLRARMYAYDVKWRPGSHYLYGSVSMQLLWDVMNRRLGGKSVTRYFEERVWSALGAEYDAAWSLDSEASGIEKLFGGFSATTRDHARLGLLFLHGGTMDGVTVVSPEWIRESLSPDPVAGVVRTTDGNVRRGKYQWFWTRDGRSYFAKGYLGQYVFVVPDKRMVFVRFGDDYGDVHWPSLFVSIADSLPAEAAGP